MTWTEASEEHIARHAVQPHEVEDTLYSQPRRITPGRNGTQLVFGTTRSGRHLLVVTGQAHDGGISIVTARDMTAAEQRLFRRQRN